MVATRYASDGNRSSSLSDGSAALCTKRLVFNARVNDVRAGRVEALRLVKVADGLRDGDERAIPIELFDGPPREADNIPQMGGRWHAQVGSQLPGEAAHRQAVAVHQVGFHAGRGGTDFPEHRRGAAAFAVILAGSKRQDRNAYRSQLGGEWSNRRSQGHEFEVAPDELGQDGQHRPLAAIERARTRRPTRPARFVAPVLNDSSARIDDTDQ